MRQGFHQRNKAHVPKINILEGSNLVPIQSPYSTVMGMDELNIKTRTESVKRSFGTWCNSVLWYTGGVLTP